MVNFLVSVWESCLLDGSWEIDREGCTDDLRLLFIELIFDLGETCLEEFSLLLSL